MRKKEQTTENYLEKKPMRNHLLNWTKDDEGKVTLEVENTGWVNKIAQMLFKKPKITYVHLDDMGNFIWPIIDGEKDIEAIGKEVKEKFGEDAEPLYERLTKYFQILDSYHFIVWNDSKQDK